MQRKRDGDGDGFVDDGTPLERPWVPGVDLGPVEDAAKAKPKVPGGQQVPADVAVKRGRVGNVDTPRLQRRRERLISEIDDPGQFYKGGRHGFAMRAAELTVIESELVKRGDLKVKDRYTVSIKDKVEVPDWENGTELRSPGSGWDGRVYMVPDDTTMDTGGRPYDHWTREVPILPDHLLGWVAEGANLGGLRNRDDNRLDRMKNYARSLLEERAGGGEDDSWGPTHEAIWDRLTKGQDSRQALSRAIHDGPTPEERDFYRLLHEHFLDFAARRWPEHGDVIPVQRMSTEDDPFTSNVGWKKKAEQPKAGSSGFTSWDAMDYDEPYYHELRARRSRSGATTWVGDVPKDQILGRFGDTENELLIAKDPETLQRLIGEPDSPFATTDTPGEVGGAAAPVEMDDTFRKAVNQRGSRVNAEDMQDAWAVAVANPDDIEAIRAALPPIAIDRWQRLHGASPEESLRRGRGGMPSLEGMIAHNARRLTEAVPLTRDNLGVNGMPSSAEIVEHDPAMAKWLGITDRTSFGELRTAIARRPLANLLSDPEPDPQGIRYLKMLRRAAERDVGRRGGAVTLHRANTQGTDTPFDTKGGSGLTSWTTDYATAAKYAKGGVTVASVDVPGDRILAYDTFGIMASTGFYDFAGQDSYPLPGREVIVTSPELLDRLDRDEFPLLPPVRSVLADDGVEMAMAEPIADLKALHGVDRDWRSVRGLPPERRAAVAAAYAELPAVEPTAEVRRSWDAAATEVDQQYERLTGELGVTVEYVDADPYRTFAEMYADFVESRRLKVLRTSATGSHPYWSDETNDRFRAVHDAFGHLATGRGFDRHGEEAAYQAHTSMFSDAALPALVTELRGQNAALIETGEFADQKVGILPADIAAVIAALLALASSSRLRTADDDNLTAVGGTHHASNGRHFSAKTAAAKRDGDGDGFVDDGTPMERPWNPLTDIKPKRTVYHLTDKARFKLNPKKVPADNALAIRQRDAAGIYVAKDKYDVETWVNGHGYLRPYVVEMEVPEEVLADERWSGEGFIPGDKFDQVEVKRVIPIDAHSRETYGDYGWVESTLGSKFDDGAPTPERMFDQPYDGLPPGYRYDGPDVRDMSPEETKRLAAGARVARKARGSGKNATEDPFAAPEAPIKVLRRPAYVNVGPEHRKVTEDTFFPWTKRASPGDSWSTMGVPELPTEILHWAVYGGNMTGLNGLDHDDDTSETMSMSISAERLLRHLGYGAYVNQRLNAKLNDDEYAFHMENVWLQLTQTQGARRALSRAAHDGPSGEEAAFYRFVHQWFLQQTADDGDTEPVRRYFLRSWDDPQPRMKGGRKPKPVTEDPFAPGSRWKEQGERPSAAGSGLTSWNSLDRGPFGHPIKYAGMSGDDPYWEGDAPKDQILGRFGDVEDEVIIARDKATLDRLLGTEANPFTPVDAPGELGRAASKYPGMRPVTAEERKGLTVEGRPIPPAWTDVHIALDPDAPMQVRAFDSKGRHQYIYTAAHKRRAAAAKFARTKELATRVPKLDAAIERDAMDDPAAAATALIRHFGLRPGSTSDTKARKKAYGATTLQARHVRQYPETGRTTLSFVGKSGVNITVSTRDPDIYRIVEHWKGDKEGTVDLFPADDADVRAYVTEHLGEGFKAKDLRTLLANVMALDMVSSMRRPTTQAKFKAARNKIADAVAKALGNTRAVTLSNYIDPTVFAAWEGALP